MGLILVVLAGVGIIVNQATRHRIAPTDAYAGWKTYTSTLGDFSLRYPGSWELRGSRGVNPVVASEMNGLEIQISLESQPGTRTDNFGIELHISPDTSKTPYPTYDSGTTTKLANGITVWQEKALDTWATGSVPDACPALQIGTDDTYTQPLRSGRYLSVYGSFCWAQKLTTAKTYDQQLASPDWAMAMAIVQSIHFN